MNIRQSAVPFLIVAVPLLTAFVLPVIGSWRRSWAFPLTAAALAAACAAAIATAHAVLTAGPARYFPGGWAPPWGIELRVDALGALMLLLVSGVALLVAVYSQRSVPDELPGREGPFYGLYLLLVAGLAGIAATADLFNLYVFLEISSLASYALVALGTGAAVFSAFRYLVLGTVGAAFYLLGVGYLYSVTGSLNMTDLAGLLPGLHESNAVRVGFAFVTLGLAIKMAVFPLHAWLPGAYADAPSAVSALVAATSTKVAAYALARIVFFVFEPRFAMETVPAATLLSWMGTAGMIAGSVMAIAQSDLKRMLAYSSVGQIGYVAAGIGLANAAGLTGGLLHLVNHAVMKGCLFLAAGAVVHRTGAREIRDLRNLSKKMPWTAAAFAVTALSMIGIPPTSGFFSKLYLVLGAVEAGRWTLVAAILLSSVLALAYFANVVRQMFLPPDDPAGERPATDVRPHDAPLTMLAPTLILAAGTVALGLFNGAIVSHFIDAVLPAGIVR